MFELFYFDLRKGFLEVYVHSFTMYRQQSDIARLEAKVERLEAQLQQKDREIATITRTVSPVKFQLRCFFLRLLINKGLIMNSLF